MPAGTRRWRGSAARGSFKAQRNVAWTATAAGILGMFPQAVAAETPPSSTDDEGGWWHCTRGFPWEECRKYLTSERAALSDFLRDVMVANEPPEGSLQGRGIVMSGGPPHVLMAIANLKVLREIHHSKLPVEFWHAFELSPAHCDALARLGAKCKQLQVPGVYPQWQTTMPSIMSSDFEEVIWLDTDITPLIDPAILFETEEYQRDGALFWPDLWGAGCIDWGETAWPWHIAWNLLDIKYNETDPRFTMEHEAGHLLIDRRRHWRPLCLANYLASRHFFTRVLYGYKDVFRLAWLKLNASGWHSAIRPGIVGLPMASGQMFPGALVHFWPGDALHGHGCNTGARPLPIYLHQKKVPGFLWGEVATFTTPLGTCVPYRMPFFPSKQPDVDVWFMPENCPALASALQVASQRWDEGYSEGFLWLKADPRISESDLRRVRHSRSNAASAEFAQDVRACPCDYTDNRWPIILTSVSQGAAGATNDMCSNVTAGPEADACPVGHALLALICSQAPIVGHWGSLQYSRSMVNVLMELLPRLTECLHESFWPMRLEELQDFVGNATVSEEPLAYELTWRGNLDMPWSRMERFSSLYRRCIPMPDSQCWAIPENAEMHEIDNGLKIRVPFTSCIMCCNKANRAQPWYDMCWNDVYTEKRCCNAA